MLTDGRHGLMHILKTSVIAGLFAAEDRFHFVAQGGKDIFRLVFKLQLGEGGDGNQVARLGFEAVEGVKFGTPAKFEVFGAEAGRVIGHRQADQVAFTAIGEIRLNFH